MNLPTWITVSRLLAVPLILFFLPQATANARWWSLGFFLIAAGTDWLDGFLARRLNQVTDLGKFLDPLVDKLLVMAPLLVLLKTGQVAAWGVFLILARELTIAGWRVNPSLATSYASTSPQSSAQPTIQGANLWGKLKTVGQIVAIALLMAPLPKQLSIISQTMFWVAVALTLISGIIYLWPTKNQSAEQSSAHP